MEDGRLTQVRKTGGRGQGGAAVTGFSDRRTWLCSHWGPFLWGEHEVMAHSLMRLSIFTIPWPSRSFSLATAAHAASAAFSTPHSPKAALSDLEKLLELQTKVDQSLAHTLPSPDSPHSPRCCPLCGQQRPRPPGRCGEWLEAAPPTGGDPFPGLVTTSS